MQPEAIGPYRITGTLGTGGMGIVYRARAPGAGVEVAVKTARSASDSTASLRGEIRALARIRHPRVVRVVAEGVQDGVPWYAMDIVEGRTWQAFNQELWPAGRVLMGPGSATTMDRDLLFADSLAIPAMPLSAVNASGPGFVGEELPAVAAGRLLEVLTLARRLCVPLALLHGAGIVHRDLKPANVIIRPDGTPVLMDFGVASRFRGAVGRERLEIGGSVVGTLAYMSPEQARGMRVDARADLYSLGCILYETLTGRLPIAGDTVQGMLARVVGETPLPPSTFVSGVPPELERLVMALLAKSPRERLGHADDVAEILEGLGAVDEAATDAAPAWLYRPEMAGRGEALEKLVAAVTRTAGGSGGVALIGGESGAGKTLLANEVARVATGRRLTVAVGECLPVLVSDVTSAHADRGGAPLHPLRSFLQTVVDACRTGGATATAALVGEHAALLAAYEPGFAQLPGVKPGGLGAEGEAGRRRLLAVLTSTFDAFLRLFGPLLLVLDDLQWADELTMDFLLSLPAEWLSSRKLLVLGTFRSEEMAGELEKLAARPDVLNVALGRLDEKAVASVVSDMLAVPAPPLAFVHFIATQTEGNPFFVAEYLRLAVSERLLVRRDGRWSFAQDDDTSFKHLPQPGSIRDLIDRRIASVSPEARALLEVAAVLGREVAGPLLLAVEGTDPEAATSLFAELLQRQVFEPGEGDDKYRFTHDKVREAAYARLDSARRKLLHRRAAQAIQAADGAEPPSYGLLAHHWRGAEDWAPAVDCLEKAAERALREFSNREAIGYLDDAVEISQRLPEPVSPARHGRWERSLADAWLDLGDVPSGTTHADRALQRLGQPRLPATPGAQAFGLFREVIFRMTVGWLPRSWLAADPAHAGAITDAAHVYNRLLEPKLLNNELLLGFYCGLRNVNLAERVRVSPALARGYAMLSAVISATPLKRVSRDWAGRAAKAADDLGNADVTSYVYARAATHFFTVGEWDEAERWYMKGVAAARANRDQRRLDEIDASLCALAMVRGRFTEGLEIVRRALASANTRGDVQARTWGRGLLLELLSRLGREQEALAEAVRARDDLARVNDGERCWFHANIAFAQVQAGDLAAARAAADIALASARRAPPVVFFVGPALSGLCDVYVRLWEDALKHNPERAKELREAAGHASDILTAYSRHGHYTRPLAALWRGSIAWISGKESKARREWNAALEEATRLGMVHAQGAILLEMGRHTEGAERREALGRAIATFEACGVSRDLARAREALGAATAA